MAAMERGRGSGEVAGRGGGRSGGGEDDGGRGDKDEEGWESREKKFTESEVSLLIQLPEAPSIRPHKTASHQPIPTEPNGGTVVVQSSDVDETASALPATYQRRKGQLYSSPFSVPHHAKSPKHVLPPSLI
jgi:hypothetical protein